jgi:hypothetical protein
MAIRRKFLPPQAVRDLGVELNGGRVHGWAETMSDMLDTPIATIKGWAVPRTSRAARPIPGAAANLLMLLVILKRGRVSLEGLHEALDVEARKWMDSEPEEE